MVPSLRSVGVVLGALALLLSIGAGLALLGLDASRPPRGGRLAVAGLGAPVEIRFDRRARPYVRASSLGDALFAQGFLHARERSWQMELLRRAGRGRLAEALGAGLLEADRELWRAGVPQLARRLEALARPTTRERVDHYVAGVNAGIASLPVPPPALWIAGVALPRWEPLDVFGLGALLAFDSANNAEHELLRAALAERLPPGRMAAFLPDEARFPDFPYVLPGAADTGGSAAGAAGPSAAGGDRPPVRSDTLARREALDPVVTAGRPSLALGSNGWVVAPDRSASGHALFAFDSHDALALPNLFYEVHLFFDRGRQIRGGSVPGLPGVVNGFNERIAWGFTNIGDTQDLFAERRHPEDPLRFYDGRAWVVARIEEVGIPVRGRDAPERLRIVHTHNGPLVQEEPPLSLAWTAHRLDGHGLDALFDLNLARDWVSFREACDRFPAPSSNLTYADVEGHVAFRTVGLLPRRGRGRGLLPQPGDDPAARWQGLVPASELPERLDPPEAFAAAANARVWPAGAGPLVSADNAPGYRIGRIRRVLGARRDHTPASQIALQRDWWNGQAARLLPALLAAIEAPRLSGAAATARAGLRRWAADPVNGPDRFEPLVFERWVQALLTGLFAEAVGEELWPRLLRRNYLLQHALDGLLLATPESPWWEGGREARIRRAYLDAVAGLEAELGPDTAGWRWDRRHAVVLEHELGRAAAPLGAWLHRGPFPWGGGVATVGRANSRYADPERVTHAATLRLVAEMSEPIRAWSILPGGQSGHPRDPHYADQTAAWLAGEPDRLAATPEEVDPVGVLVLEPAP